MGPKLLTDLDRAFGADVLLIDSSQPTDQLHLRPAVDELSFQQNGLDKPVLARTAAPLNAFVAMRFHRLA
jgi:hypothetical protein